VKRHVFESRLNCCDPQNPVPNHLRPRRRLSERVLLRWCAASAVEWRSVETSLPWREQPVRGGLRLLTGPSHRQCGDQHCRVSVWVSQPRARWARHPTFRSGWPMAKYTAPSAPSVPNGTSPRPFLARHNCPKLFLVLLPDLYPQPARYNTDPPRSDLHADHEV
jgi:hypothetical protein